MDLVVVDTDVLSFIFKSDSRGAAYKPHLAGKEIIISFMTLAELNHWAIHLTHNRRHFAGVDRLTVISEENS